MKIWLDDERPMPPGFDCHVKTASEAIELLAAGGVIALSLDHDLGDQAMKSPVTLNRRPITAGFPLLR